MVQIPEEQRRDRISPRLLEVMREAQVPGEAEDHEWMCLRIQRAADKLPDRFSRDYAEDLLVSGLLLDMGLDPAASGRLQGRCFPEAWLVSVPPLLKRDFPAAGWRLVESGILAYEPGVPDVRFSWVLKADQVRPVMRDWFELGETLVFHHLAEGLSRVIDDLGIHTRVRITGLGREEGREWARRLRKELEALGPSAVPHFVVG